MPGPVLCTKDVAEINESNTTFALMELTVWWKTRPQASLIRDFMGFLFPVEKINSTFQGVSS